MRPDKRKARRKENALAALAKLGFDATAYTITSGEEIDEQPDNLERQGEAALAFLARPQRFTTKQCLYCEEYFGTNYRSVGYCSNNCRDKHFEQQTGMKVDWGKKNDRERWLGNEPPLVVDPTTLKYLAQHYEAMQKERQNPEADQTHRAQGWELHEVAVPVLVSTLPAQTIPLPEPVESSDFELGDLDAFFENP